MIQKNFKVDSNQTQAKRVVPIGKYTSLDYFKLDSPRDQIPITFPTSKTDQVPTPKEVKPYIQSLAKGEEHYWKKVAKKDEEHKKKLRGARHKSGKETEEINEKVQDRMDSKYL